MRLRRANSAYVTLVSMGIRPKVGSMRLALALLVLALAAGWRVLLFDVGVDQLTSGERHVVPQDRAI